MRWNYDKELEIYNREIIEALHNQPAILNTGFMVSAKDTITIYENFTRQRITMFTYEIISKLYAMSIFKILSGNMTRSTIKLAAKLVYNYMIEHRIIISKMVSLFGESEVLRVMQASPFSSHTIGMIKKELTVGDFVRQEELDEIVESLVLNIESLICSYRKERAVKVS